MSIPESEEVKDPCEYMASLVQNFLPIKHWGFKESFRSKEELIFDSQWCRVSFIWSGWDMYTGYSMSRYYGRLHAPNNKVRMNWNGEECYCWHSLIGTGGVLEFLDGMTPQESINHKQFPQIIEEMRQTEWWRNMANNRRGPELTIRMEAEVWDHYGLQLFELFDLRHPDLWEQYREWLKMRYVAEGKNEEKQRQFGILLPYYHIC